MIVDKEEIKTPSAEEVVKDLAKEYKNGNGASDDGIERLPVGGVRVRITTIPDMALFRIEADMGSVPIPLQYVESKGREEPNPNDPEYLLKKSELEQQKAIASLNNAIIFGIELVDEVPKKAEKQLKFLGILKDGYDDFDLEFQYKLHVLFNNSTNTNWLTSKISVSQEAISKTAATF